VINFLSSYLPTAALCIVITVIVELLVAVVYKIYSYKVIIVVNVSTQVLLHIVLITTFFTPLYMYASWVFYCTEVIILLLEFLLYSIFIKNKTKLLVWFYVLTANLATFLLGLLIDI